MQWLNLKTAVSMSCNGQAAARHMTFIKPHTMEERAENFTDMQNAVIRLVHCGSFVNLFLHKGLTLCHCLYVSWFHIQYINQKKYMQWGVYGSMGFVPNNYWSLCHNTQWIERACILVQVPLVFKKQKFGNDVLN